MSINVRQFDDQHKKLVEMVQRLNDAMKKGEGMHIVSSILSDLANYAESHLSQEEKFLQQNNYPDFAAHKQIHDDLRKKLGEVLNEYHAGRIVPAEIMNFLSDWLINHIMKVDKKYGVFVNKKGIH
jgi:hemerythrin